MTAGLTGPLLNGSTGNGFDDDCDGLVDEGCPCPGNGQTKDCWLVPATQADPANDQPVGWCNPNAKGSLDCNGGELATWSGICRGATAPQTHDSCSPGDFNCDGLSGNSDQMGCSCGTTVTCPTNAITLAPYPTATAIPLVDGSQWITDSSQRASAMNWTWTVLGGDCDNVLPHPTFALFKSATASSAVQGIRTPVKFDSTAQKYVATPGEALISVQAVNYGTGVAGGQVYTAFALSGDYTVQGEFDLNGEHFVCTQKVQVRAPGVRAELCWDTVGGDESSNPAGNDIDLHFARLQGTSCNTSHGWDDSCPGNLVSDQDCFYGDCGDELTDVGWGFAASATTACHGWGSRRQADCFNPRLDLDNITCDRTVADPNNEEFCGPENINLDNPADGDKFVIGVNHYDNHGGTSNAKPHVNIYCNGARVLSIGYNPATGAAWPLLKNPGQDSSGDLWTSVQVTTHVAGGSISSCDVATIPSHHADTSRDGPAASSGAGNDLCVDSTHSAASPAYNYTNHEFVDHTSLQGIANGAQPTLPAQFCKH